jgi:hypothetical protein
MTRADPLGVWSGFDLPHAKTVEVLWDSAARRLWINTEDGCIGRIYNVEQFHFREAQGGTDVCSREA